MKESVLRKNKILGMKYGTACHRLRSNILFSLIKKLNLDSCYHCKKTIKTVKELSIEHIDPWLNSDNPQETFWDLDNVAFSHLRCNCSNSHNPNKTGFKGVFKVDIKSKPWRAQCWYEGRPRHIGNFKTRESAAKAYDNKMRELYGDDCITNACLNNYKAD